MIIKKIVFVGFVVVLSMGALQAQPKLERGKDHIEYPAVGEGLCLHNLFQSNMVIQRDKPVSIWGWATPGESVTVAFGDQSVATTADKDRLWKVSLSAMKANTKPQTLTVKGKAKTLTLENVLVGDVWILGGQSNMEFPLGKIENGGLEIVSAKFKNIRILTVPTQNGPKYKKGFARLHEWSSWLSRHFRKGDWDVCSPEIARELSGIGYVFARRLHMATQIPIGVIDASRGGTTLETWTPYSVLKKIDTPEVKAKLAEWDEKIAAFDPQKDLENRIKNHENWVAKMKKSGREIPANRKRPTDLKPGPAMDPNRPGNCYASMLAPLAGLSARGVIWHQGYNNCFNGVPGARMYYQIFGKMITAWRTAFNDSQLAFGIITLCTQGNRQTGDQFVEQMLDTGPYIREAQYKTFLDFYNAGDKNIGFTVTYDLHRRWYHPQLKIPAGERIARWALATQYKVKTRLRWKPPIIKEMKIEGNQIQLSMDELIGGVDDGGPMEGFSIAGKDGKFYPADIDHLVTGKDGKGRPKKNKKVLVLSSSFVSEPVHYRYAWARSPLGNIQISGHSDVPLATQRSDDWSRTDLYEAYTGKKTKTAELDRQERGQLIRALRQADLQRRNVEIKNLIEAQEKK